MRGRHRRRLRRAGGLVLALGLLALAACGPLPRPFGRDAADPPNPLADEIFLEGVEVPPLDGTTRPMGRLLAEAVTTRLERDYQIPAATDGLDNSRYVLSGQVYVPADDRPPGAPGGVSIGWELDQRGGANLMTFVQDIDATRLEWEYGDPKILAVVADAMGERVARLVLGGRFGIAGEDRLLGRRGVAVAEVVGAPGDGNGALRRAMTVALAGYGVQVVSAANEAAFGVAARVEVGPPKDGAQAIRIVWTVSDVAGEALGTAQQRNAVPAGSLDGRWGQTAAFVAAAAVDGIVGILRRNDPGGLRAPALGPGAPSGTPRSGTAPPAPPTTPALPRIPGRAPPPPR